MTNSLRFSLATLCLLVAHLVVLIAPFAAPYDYADQDRLMPYAPPIPIHFVDVQGRIHVRPFIYQRHQVTGGGRGYVEETDKLFPIHVFVHGSKYRLAGFAESEFHLFGVDGPARLSLMGTDMFGRDVFSRWIFGGRVSLFAGLLAAALSLIIGGCLGAIAGFYGGWIDAVVMRVAELFFAVPWLYLLFAVRACLPLHIEPAQAFILILGIVGIVGWARPARIVRGVVLSARERGYVLASRGFGASNFYVLRRHVLPQTQGVILTQAALLVPQFVLAEVTLSFLGLGVGEPVPSWGGMLACLQQYHVLVTYWWMGLPGLALIPIFVSYGQLSQALQKRATA